MARAYVAVAGLVLAMASQASAPARANDEVQVVGIIGMDRVDEGAAVAFWTPLAAGELLTGFSWFNNDGAVAFPEVRALAAPCDRPDLLDAATVVGGSALGGDSSWSHYQFEMPLSSASDGLFVILTLPPGSACTEAGYGGGAGVGYASGDGRRRCWFTAAGEPWEALSGAYRMAVTCDITADKGLRSLRIGVDSSVARPADPVVAVDLEEPASSISLQVSPNPFNPVTDVSFSLSAEGPVTLTIYDLRGRAVRSLHNGPMVVGTHHLTWNGRDDAGHDLPSGVYIARLIAGATQMTARLTLLQ